MLYILDANVLIDANRDYYPMDRVPEFWEWLLAMGNAGLVKTPPEVYEKVAAAGDSLSQWLKNNRDALLLDESVDEVLLHRVIAAGYAPDLTDIEIEQLNEDPFLIAYALVDPENRRVVSNETSSPSKMRANRKVPDVCDYFNVRHCNAFRFIRDLDFRTNWRR